MGNNIENNVNSDKSTNVENSERKQQTEAFRQWILQQTGTGYDLHVNEKDPNSIIIETEYGFGEVAFYPMDIIQLSVLNKVTDSHVFYLHFQMHTPEHAQNLFEEMLETIQELTVKPPVKILLCCSSGLTTGYFAEKLNESAAQMALNYVFSAVSYHELYHVGNQYDLILLAPQISYIYKKAKQILEPRIVRQIPAKVFASYDVQQMFSDIRQYLTSSDTNDQKQDSGSVHPLPLKQPIQIQHKILTIALIREEADQFHFASRLYDKGCKILFDEDIIKNRLCLNDLYDICDTAFARHPDIGMVGIAMPGIVNKGHLSLLSLGLDNTDIIGALTEKYGRKFILDNDANSVVVGYFASQDRYQSLSFLFQPIIGARGGVGSIYNGQLINGRSHIAGEVQYLPYQLSCDKERFKTPEGALELAGQTIAPIISILDPDAVLFFCRLIVQSEELAEEIAHYIPKQYIPDIIKIDNLREYVLMGQLILCSQSKPE